MTGCVPVVNVGRVTLCLRGLAFGALGSLERRSPKLGRSPILSWVPRGPYKRL